jgi:hypothetical protein
MMIALNILKLLGLVLTGAFGILGLLTDFRDDKTKKITKWGKIALLGIILSTALSIVAQLLESAKSVREARESEKQARDQITKSNEILNNLNRSLNPLTNVRITYWLKVPINAPELAAYRKRLTHGVAGLLADGRIDAKMRTAFVARSNQKGQAEVVGIPRGSSLMPRRDEAIAYYLIRYSGLQFSFLKNHYNDADFVGDPSKRPRPDLFFGVITEFGGKSRRNRNYSLDYDLRTKELTLYASDLLADPQSWTSDNQIQAVPDLPNVQMAVTIDDTFVPRITKMGERDKQGIILSRVRSQMELDALILKINTRELWIKRSMVSDFRRVTGGTAPIAVYLTVFPKSIDDLQLPLADRLNVGAINEDWFKR